MTDQGVGATYARGGRATTRAQQPDDSTTDRVKEQVKDTAEAAKEKARDVKAQARGRLSDQVDQRSTQFGERIAGTAGDVRSVAEELRRQDKQTPARLAEQAADQAERLGDYLKSANGDRILRDAERYTRDNPWLVAGGGLVLGFAASRLLKASSGRRYGSLDSSLDSGTTTSAYGPVVSAPPAPAADPYDAGTVPAGAPTYVTSTPTAYPPPAPVDPLYDPEQPVTDPTWTDPAAPPRRDPLA